MATPDYGFDPSLPPELAAEQASLARRKRIAEMMMQRGMTPVQSANPRSPISWTQGLAQVLQAYQGGQAMQDVDRAQTGLAQRYQQGLADEVRRVATMRSGRPASSEAIIDEQAAGGEGAPAAIEAPAVPADPRGAIQAALTSQYAPVREMGKLEHQTYEREQTRAGDREARLQERIMSLDAAAQNQALAREQRAQLAAEANALRRELAQMQANLRRELKADNPPAVTPVTIQDPNNPNATVVIDARTRDMLGKGPKLTDTGKAEFKRQFNMQGIGATIKQAEDLLNGTDPATGRPISKPTGSGVGKAVDTVAGFFGASPAGAVEAQQLKAVAGALTSKMPRMEGPQSDKDVLLYREMAAEIGNDSLPIDRRQKALEIVKNLWVRYERLNPEAFEGGAAPAAPGSSGVRMVDW